MLTRVELLIIVLLLLIGVSAFFSSSETGVMALNRYRLRHLSRSGDKRAKRVSRLLERPDRLLGVVLIGNTFANIFASAIATMIAVNYFGELGVVIATGILTLVILIFSEIAPKTVAAIYPERVAFWASWPLTILLSLLYPLVWLANGVANTFLRLFKVNVKHQLIDHLSHEEMRTLVNEALTGTTTTFRHMMLGILDLSSLSVEDIQIPRNDIAGIDLDDEWSKILDQITGSQYTRLPIFRESIDQVIGILHVRKVLNLLTQEKLSKESLEKMLDDVYFIPEGTPLHVQVMNFRLQKQRIGLIVDEYGDIQGLITLEDILEEIIGEFTTDFATQEKQIQKQKDGSVIVEGGMSLRELNRRCHWAFPTEGPKTLSGLIIEYLETIPQSGVCMRIAGYPIEVTASEGNTLKTVRVLAQFFSDPEADIHEITRSHTP